MEATHGSLMKVTQMEVAHESSRMEVMERGQRHFAPTSRGCAPDALLAISKGASQGRSVGDGCRWIGQHSVSPRLDAEVGRGTPSSAFGALPLSRSSASMASSTLGVWRKSCTVRSHHILRHLAHRTPDVLHRRASLAITQTSSSEYYTDEPHLLTTEARRTWSAMPASYLTAKWVK